MYLSMNSEVVFKLFLGSFLDVILAQMELHFGTVWEPHAAKLNIYI